MTLRPARFRNLRKFWCWFAGQHHWTAVRKHWHRDRFGRRAPTETVIDAILDDLHDAYLACMTCGKFRAGFSTPVGTILAVEGYPTWIPPRYRQKATCPLCLLQTYDEMCWRCDACGVTGEMLARVGLR